MFRTKKLKSLSAGLLILFMVALFTPLKTAKAAEATYDQGCTPSTVANVKIAGHSSIYQTFTPTQNRLSRIGIHLKSDGSEPGISFRIITMGNQTLAGSSIITVPNTGESYWVVYFDYNDVELTPSTMYKIVPSTANNNIFWHRSSIASCSAGGYAYLDGEEQNYDFGFATFGWTYTSPQPGDQTGDQTGTQPGIDTTKNLGAAPSKNISTAIKPPTDVKAVNASTEDKIAIKITWTKSVTEDIDGYKVFRKEEGKDYGQVAQAEKTITEFTDFSAVEGTKYIYMVRSYKGNAESENSNEASITASKAKEKSPIPIISSLEDISWKDPIFLAALGSLAVAALGFLLWYLIYRRKQKEVEAK